MIYQQAVYNPPVKFETEVTYLAGALHHLLQNPECTFYRENESLRVRRSRDQRGVFRCRNGRERGRCADRSILSWLSQGG